MRTNNRKVRRRNRRTTPEPVKEEVVVSISDYFKAVLGWKPSQRPFHTTANRECGACRAVKPGSEFDVPVTPGRPDLNVCRGCAA